MSHLSCRPSGQIKCVLQCAEIYLHSTPEHHRREADQTEEAELNGGRGQGPLRGQLIHVDALEVSGSVLLRVFDGCV